MAVVPAVRITVITFRRPHLLDRALRSIQTQVLPYWTAEVVNDDPADPEPARLVARLGDPRIAMVEPAVHRGGSANLNFAFRPGPSPYASVLEDDNWWEPDFLSTLVPLLEARPDIALVVANQRVWQEQEDGTWRRTDSTIRPDGDRLWEFSLHAQDKCGRSVLSNSAMLFRPGAVADWSTPDGLPVDVTEHYRERLVPHPILMCDRVVGNFAETRATNRSGDPMVWSAHQVLLVASVFATLPPGARPALARTLLDDARRRQSHDLTTLLLAGLTVREARALWQFARPFEKLKLGAHLAWHRGRWRRYQSICADHAAEWVFLGRGWVADALRQGEQAKSAAGVTA
jgi:hypothetical protein